MKTFLVLVSMFVSSIALAQTPEVPTDAQVAAKKAECDVKYTTPLARSQCQLLLTIMVLEFKSRAAGADTEAIKKELAHQRILLDSITKSLAAIASKAEAQKPEAAPAPVPAPTAPAPQAAMLPPQAMMMGAPYQVIDPPGSLVAATWDVFGDSPFRAEISSIKSACQMFGCSGGMWRVVVFKNSQQLQVQQREAPGFMEFYADVNGDNKTDSIPSRGFDPNFSNSIFVGFQQSDVIDLVFLTPVSTIAIPGLPIQTVWGNPKHVRFMKRNQVSHDDLGRPQFSGLVSSSVD